MTQADIDSRAMIGLLGQLLQFVSDAANFVEDNDYPSCSLRHLYKLSEPLKNSDWPELMRMSHGNMCWLEDIRTQVIRRGGDPKIWSAGMEILREISRQSGPFADIRQ